MQMNRTHFVKIFALVYLLATSALLFWVVYEITTTAATLKERVDTIAYTKAKEKVYKDLSVLVGETQVDRQKLTEFVLTEDQTGTFLTDIERIGQAQGVLLTTNSLNVVESVEGPDQLLVQFAVDGKEVAVKKMLTIFETLPYHSQISSINFESDEEGNAKSTLDVVITLVDYGG